MSEKTEITFMQTRLIRLASEKCYGIFHCEDDEAVLEDITEFLQGKGIEISA